MLLEMKYIKIVKGGRYLMQQLNHSLGHTRVPYDNALSTLIQFPDNVHSGK